MQSPEEVWQEMLAGNARFVAGAAEHPHQDLPRRHELAMGQNPVAAVFACSDSRVAAELIFDTGLGDLFVIRNAGQVVNGSSVGSIEFAVDALHVPLIVVLGHESCGAVQAAIDVAGPNPPELSEALAELIAPIDEAVRRMTGAAKNAVIHPEKVDAAAVGAEHVRLTIEHLLMASPTTMAAVQDGSLAVVGATYELGTGAVTQLPHAVIGFSG